MNASVNSAKIGCEIYTRGHVCLKHPNEWHSVMFGNYLVQLITDALLDSLTERLSKNLQKNSCPL